MATREDSIAIPGTVHLIDVTGYSSSSESKGGIELIPRPTGDPEDPLNWNSRRKKLSAIMVFIYTIGVGLPGTLQYSVLADITKDTGISTAALVQGTGLQFLFLGWGCLIWQPIALRYGRRGVYLISTLVTVPLMVWTAYSTSAGEWCAHRFLLGIFDAPIESLPEVSIPDIFFAHERGSWMALYVFVLFASNFLAPLIAGWFAEAFGWRWTMHFGAMIAAVAFVVLFFFMEETMYERQTLEGLEETEPETKNVPLQGEPVNPEEKTAEEGEKHQVSSQTISTGSSFSPPKSYIQKLAPFSKPPVQQANMRIFRSIFMPLLYIVQFPSVAWAGFIYGINLSWYNVLNGTASPVLSAAPYNWSTGLVGCIYTGPIIGAAIGSLWSGIVADRLTLRLAQKNNGIREPEQRLWPLALSAAMTCIGLVTWGVGAAHHVHWAGLAIGLGLLTIGVVTGGSVALSYNIDCFKDISGDTTTSIIIIRNTLGFAISYGITPWYTNMGLQNCFIMAAFLALGCTATFLIMIWKGKALRKWSAKRYWKYAEYSNGH